ncbi:MAG: hypothetical protein AABZ31_06265, partial [Bdellovibrionota bacterium]
MSEKFFRLFLFILLSFVEVKVKAELVTVPKNCLKNLLSCSIRSENDAAALNFGAGEIRLLKNSEMTRLNAHRIKIIKGQMMVRATARPIYVESFFSRIEIKNGLAILDASDERVVVNNLTAEIGFIPLGSKERVVLPAGLMNEFGPVQTSGIAKTQYPRSMPLTGFIEKWARFFVQSEFAVFKSDFEEFIPKWRESLSLVGPWYLETI